MSARPFKTINTEHPGHSVFDLSYQKLMTGDLGVLYPVFCEEVIPSDKWTIGNECVIRFNPLVAPVLHEINCYVHYFFVPYRLLWFNSEGEEYGWERFITGGPDGGDTSTIPVWTPPAGGYGVNTMWDYFGFPINVDTGDVSPIDFSKRAYNLIYNEYYRDENLQNEVDIVANDALLFRNWSKDYFTSALPWQQRGTPPALPLSGIATGNASFYDYDLNRIGFYYQSGGDITVTDTGAADAYGNLQPTSGASGPSTGYLQVDNAGLNQNEVTVDLSNGSLGNIADLRLAFQIQRWLERNARGGVRYVEFIHNMFGISPRDERLQRPEYIGGSKAPVIISEVLQTSQTTTGAEPSPQGNMAGHGISVNQQFAGKYYSQEYGLIMGIMSIMPVPSYSCQGINRQWLRKTRYDFYFPQFANLSEQAIENAEIFVTSGDDVLNKGIFGYQGRYDEMRYKPNMCVAEMRPEYTGGFSQWNLSRSFSTLPTLSEQFISCDPQYLTRIYAVQDQPGLLIHFSNLLKVIRPLPITAEPGLIDHN